MIRILACLCLLSSAGVARAESTDNADELTKHALRQIMGAIRSTDTVRPGASAAELRHLIRMAYKNHAPDEYVMQLMTFVEKADQNSEHDALDRLSRRLYARIAPTIDTSDPYLASILAEGFATRRLEPGGNTDWLERRAEPPVYTIPVENRPGRQTQVYLAALESTVFDASPPMVPAARRQIEVSVPPSAAGRGIVPRIEVDTVGSAPPDRPQVVSVEKGDTLGDIALRYYGSAVRYREIASVNNLRNPDRLSIGQKLILP